MTEEQCRMDDFARDLSELGVVLSEKQYGQFCQYYNLLLEWNKVMNLTSITNFDDVVKKHFVDSLTLVKAYNISEAVKGVDVGSGAGFPGLALKIAFPGLEMTLLDSLGKRVRFLEAVIEQLGLKGVRAIHGRAEDWAVKGKLRESFDLCVSRAVANLSTLSEYCIPFVKQDGMFVSYKSEKISEELEAAGGAVELLGGRIVGRAEFMLPNSDIFRSLVMVQKVKPTPAKYPRKAGLPGKEPL